MSLGNMGCGENDIRKNVKVETFTIDGRHDPQVSSDLLADIDHYSDHCFWVLGLGFSKLNYKD